MDLFNRYLRLLLTAATLLLPAQYLLAAPSDMQADIQTGQVAQATVTTNDAPYSGTQSMSVKECSERGGSGNCQGSDQCGNCPVSSGISQITPKHLELGSQPQPSVLNISILCTDPLPDYRPPRLS